MRLRADVQPGLALLNHSRRIKTGRTSRIAWGILAALVLALFAMQSSALIEWLDLIGFSKFEKIRLGAYQGDVGALEWIAQEQGFYHKVGLSVELTGYVSGKDATDALYAGQVDVATASEFVAASRSLGDPSLRILASISYYRNKGIVARRDRGITEAADLRGKRIGVTAPSGAEYSLYVFLALHGLSFQDVTIVNLPPQQIVSAIESGNIDAAITWQPHVQQIEGLLGTGGISFRGDGFDTYLLLLTQQEKLSSSPVKKLLRALLLAEDWVQSHPAEAKRLVAARFKLTPEYVETLWPNMPLEVTLPQELLVALDGEARWLRKKEGKAAENIPNYANFIRVDELKSVRPSAVTVFSQARGALPTAAVKGP